MKSNASAVALVSTGRMHESNFTFVWDRGVYKLICNKYVQGAACSDLFGIDKNYLLYFEVNCNRLLYINVT